MSITLKHGTAALSQTLSTIQKHLQDSTGVTHSSSMTKHPLSQTKSGRLVVALMTREFFGSYLETRLKILAGSNSALVDSGTDGSPDT
jgi:hypothetical protein